MRITVHVHPGSKAPGVGGLHGDQLVVRVRERADDGAATEAVLSALAEAFSVATRNVTCVRGATSRTKIIEISGDEATLAVRLAQLATGEP